jgi:hypothetical protein
MQAPSASGSCNKMVPKCRYRSKTPPSGVQRKAPEISKCAKSKPGRYTWKADFQLPTNPRAYGGVLLSGANRV